MATMKNKVQLIGNLGSDPELERLLLQLEQQLRPQLQQARPPLLQLQLRLLLLIVIKNRVNLIMIQAIQLLFYLS